MRFKGLAYRSHNPAWSFDPLSGEGAKSQGGRFNPKGVPALYLSLSQTGALAEYNQGFPHRPQPVTLCAYDIDSDDIVDINDTDELVKLGISVVELNCAWELLAAEKKLPPTWALSICLMDNNYAGIITPSFARNAPKGANNLVLWDWGDTLPHQVKLIDDQHRLPKDQSSWKGI